MSRLTPDTPTNQPTNQTNQKASMSALLALLQQKKQEMAAGNRRKTIKPADGSSRYRILPSWNGADKLFHRDFGQHYVKNAAKEITAVYVCTEKTFGKPCSICDAISHGMRSATDDFTMDILKGSRSTGRTLLNVLHLDSKDPGEVHILELPATVFKQVIDIAYEYEEAGQSILDLNTGSDLVISRTGTGIGTKYTVMRAAKSSPVSPSVLTKLHNLDEYVSQESSDGALRALNSVRAVTGLLPAPASTGLPRAVESIGAASIAEEDPYAVAEAPVRKLAPAPAPAPDISDVPVKAAPVAAKPVAPVAAKPAPVAAESTGDEEMDALLASLG